VLAGTHDRAWISASARRVHEEAAVHLHCGAWCGTAQNWLIRGSTMAVSAAAIMAWPQQHAADARESCSFCGSAG
jgi:hypothetical protein